MGVGFVICDLHQLITSLSDCSDKEQENHRNHKTTVDVHQKLIHSVGIRYMVELFYILNR